MGIGDKKIICFFANIYFSPYFKLLMKQIIFGEEKRIEDRCDVLSGAMELKLLLNYKININIDEI